MTARQLAQIATWLLLVAMALASGSSRAAGELDPQFGDEGQVTLARPVEFAAGNAQVGDVATLADGRILWTMENGIGQLWIARMLRNGQFDAGFGGTGRIEIEPCLAFRPARLVAFEDGGALVWAAGCLVRVRADGSIDTAFGSATNGPTSAFFAVDLVGDGAGRWLLAGTENQIWRVYRFLADGNTDPTFASNGVASVTPATSNGTRTLHAMALRPDGRIVLTGSRGNLHGTNLVVAQLDADGMPDSGFGADGIIDLPAPQGYAGIVARALVLDRDGSILLGGEAHNGMHSCCVMFARFDAGGTPAPVALRIFPLGANVGLSPFGETSMTLALLPHGKILMARIAFPFVVTTRTRFTLVRMHDDGSLDESFDTQGWRSYVVSDPTQTGQSGPYSQLHGMVYANGEALLFGRTFFEDESIGVDYVTLMRTRFDALHADGFGLDAADGQVRRP